jgi:hypothetical protein
VSVYLVGCVSFVPRFGNDFPRHNIIARSYTIYVLTNRYSVETLAIASQRFGSNIDICIIYYINIFYLL